MDTRKHRRSPKRDYTRSGNSYSSPSRRNHRSWSRSRSPVHRRHFSPIERRHSSRSSPKRRKSRSRSPGIFRSRFSKENDAYSIRRSRSNERKLRKNDSIKKPLYRGPENSASLGKAVTSPVRVVLVQRKGEGKSPTYSDEKPVTQKQTNSNSRSRTILDGNEMTERRTGLQESKDPVDVKLEEEIERRVYVLKIEKRQNGSALSSWLS